MEPQTIKGDMSSRALGDGGGEGHNSRVPLFKPKWHSSRTCTKEITPSQYRVSRPLTQTLDPTMSKSA